LAALIAMDETRDPMLINGNKMRIGAETSAL
jgi:hypothetical protein